MKHVTLVSTYYKELCTTWFWDCYLDFRNSFLSALCWKTYAESLIFSVEINWNHCEYFFTRLTESTFFSSKFQCKDNFLTISFLHNSLAVKNAVLQNDLWFFTYKSRLPILDHINIDFDLANFHFSHTW